MHTHHHRHQVHLRLERWHRRLIFTSLLLLLASGMVWLVVRYFMRPIGPFGPTVHPLEPWSMKMHGGAAMLVLFLLGSLMNAHIRRAIKARRNLWVGLAMLAFMSILIASSFGLYYLANEDTHLVWSATHWSAGLIGTGLFLLHIYLGRRRAMFGK